MLSHSAFPFLLLPVTILVAPFLIFQSLQPYARAAYWNDPTSIYFDSTRAYKHKYTTVRHSQADAFLESAATREYRRLSSSPPWLCVGILSIRRPEGVYLRAAVGSLLAQLHPKERDQIYLMPLIAHTDPNTHPAYAEKWLHNVADEVLLYNENHTDYQHIANLEAERARTGVPDREKHMWDYTYLMRQCKKRGAEYVLLLEDDILAMDGWFHRVKVALNAIEEQTRLQGAKTFFYLRLFFTERDWNLDLVNGDDRARIWRKTAHYLMPVTVLAGIVGYIGACYVRQRTSMRLLLIVSLALSLYMTARVTFTYIHQSGRFTALPLTPHPSGIIEMPSRGWCAQGIIYPISTIEPLTSFYAQHRLGFVDNLADELGDAHPEKMGKRWAIVPSILQHVGGKSSKGDNWGSDKAGEMSEAERIWSFRFEDYEAETLAREHERALGKMLELGEI